MAAKKRKKTSAKRATASVDLTTAPKSKRQAVVRDIRAVLRKHGIAGDLDQVHVKPKGKAKTGARAAKPARLAATATGAATAAAPAPVTPCPAGQVRRVVCFVRKGVFVCEERCVPA